jgi:protein-tyrosine-phosphatase
MTTSRVCGLLFCAIVAAAQVYSTAGQKAEENKSRASGQVLFVCEHGAAKSVIAATYFNKLARERGLPQRAIARGTQPDAAYSPSVVQGLKGDGLEVGKGKPTVVTDADLAAATYVVTLGCKLPHSPPPTTGVRAWDEVTMSEGYPAVRRAIVKRVEQFLDELSSHEGR